MRAGIHVWGPVSSQAWDRAANSVRKQISQIAAPTRDQIWNQVWLQVRAELYTPVSGLVANPVYHHTYAYRMELR